MRVWIEALNEVGEQQVLVPVPTEQQERLGPVAHRLREDALRLR